MSWRSRAKPLKVPLQMSCTMLTASCRLCGVPLMVTRVGSVLCVCFAQEEAGGVDAV
jgi:uncharacterized Zn finger protein (UPF0148 family)